MKIPHIIIFLLFLIKYSFSLKEAKNFLLEFLKATKNDNIIENISDQCFGLISDYHFLQLKKSYIENDFENISKHLENILLDTLINCPSYEFISIFKQSEYEIFSPVALKYKSKIYTKLLTLGSYLYLQYNNNTLTGASLGEIYGKIFNLFKFDYDTLYDLQVGDDEDNDEMELIINNINSQLFELFSGIFIGMKERNDGRESKCFKDIIKGKKKLLNIIDECFKKMKNGKSFSEALKSLSFKFVAIEGITVDCNLLTLGNSVLSKVTSIKEMNLLLYRMINNSNKYLTNIKQVIDNINNKKTKEAGKYIGKILSNIFDFNVK